MKVALIVLTTKQKSSGRTRRSLCGGARRDPISILEVMVKKLIYFYQIDDFQDERLRKPEMPAQLSKLYTKTQLL